MYWPETPEPLGPSMLSIGWNATWIGTTITRDDQHEEEVLERETHERERVRGKGREHDRDEGAGDRDHDAVDETRVPMSVPVQTPV